MKIATRVAVMVVMALCFFGQKHCSATQPILTENSIENVARATHDEFIGEDGELHEVNLHHALKGSGEGLYLVEDLKGQYRLNYTGASAGWSESLWYDYGTNATGKSHVLDASLEDDSNGFGNSTGAYLDIADDASIKKAYFAIEFGEDKTNKYYRYPVTVYYAPEKGQVDPTTKQLLYITDYALTTYNYSATSVKVTDYNHFGWVDFTDYISEHGKGWYYIANIPINTNTTGDWSAEWSIITIEESPKFDRRELKLSLGAATQGDTNEWSEYSIPIDGLMGREGEVVGQAFISMTDIDTGISEAQIGLDVDNGIWQSIIATNGSRTLEKPLNYIKTKNTEPLDIDVLYENTMPYFELNDGRKILQSGVDTELLEIGNSDKHNIHFLNNSTKLGWRFNPKGHVLTMHILGFTIGIENDEAILNEEQNPETASDQPLRIIPLSVAPFIFAIVFGVYYRSNYRS